MNMLAITWGETTLLVDAGVMFPDPELLGVDRIIPDLTYLQQKGSAAALVLTHGHEDHIGGVPHVLPLRQGSRLRHPADAGAGRAEAARARARGAVDGAASRAAARPRDRGPVHRRVHPGDAQHSGLRGARHPYARRRAGAHRRLQDRPDAARWPAFRHAPLRAARAPRASWRSSPTAPTSTARASPARRPKSSPRSRRSSRAPQAASSSPPSRRASTGCRFWWTSRSSSNARWPSSGAGMIENSQIAQRLGYLRIPPGMQIRDSDVPTHPAQDVLCLTTGSQGEPLSALSRIAIDDHRHVKLAPEDTVVLSARAIPGNEKAIGRVINHIARRGADVIHEGTEARPRVGARQRRGAEADAVAGAAALLHPGPRRIPPAGAARRDRAARVRRSRSAAPR